MLKHIKITFPHIKEIAKDIKNHTERMNVANEASETLHGITSSYVHI